MANEGSGHSHSRVDDHRSRHRNRSRSYDSREREVSESIREEQSDRRRHHRHRRRHSRRSLSPGEIPPPKRHRSKHGEKRPHRTPETSETREKHSLPESKPLLPLEAQIHPSPSLASESSGSDDMYGPMPAVDKQQQSRSKRLPRRGEYGHDAEEIEKFERMGFVMSGNRRKRKNDSTDDTSTKAGLTLQKEEKLLRETEIVAKFREMIQERKEMK